MRNWVAPKCGNYKVDGFTITTDGSYKEKISGTSLGAILGKSPYMSRFAVSTRLMGLWNEDISDKPAIIVGKKLEERIIDYLGMKHTDVGNFFKVEELGFGAREGDHADWKSDFEDDVFSGHIDGIVSKDGVDYILEIKTANRRQIEQYGTWLNGVPEHYLWQVYLYNHFITKQDKAYVGLGIVDQSTYDNPNSWVPCKENCKLFEITIDREMVAKVIEEVRSLYAKTIGSGVCMEYDPGNSDDVEIFNHLRDINGDMDNLLSLVTEYGKLHASNKAYEKMNKDNTDREKELADRIKDVMTHWDMKVVGAVSVTKSVRKSFDFKKAEAEGFDLAKYLAQSESDGFDWQKYIKNTNVTTINFKE